MSGFFVVLIVAIVFGFAYQVVRLGIAHAEKIERMKHGYPLKDGTMKMEKAADIIDYRDSYGNNGQMGRDQN